MADKIGHLTKYKTLKPVPYGAYFYARLRVERKFYEY
jgi:hypothetical protein